HQPFTRHPVQYLVSKLVAGVSRLVNHLQIVIIHDASTSVPAQHLGQDCPGPASDLGVVLFVEDPPILIESSQDERLWVRAGSGWCPYRKFVASMPFVCRCPLTSNLSTLRTSLSRSWRDGPECFTRQ